MTEEEETVDYFIYFWVYVGKSNGFKFIRMPVDLELYSNTSSLIDHALNHLNFSGPKECFYISFKESKGQESDEPKIVKFENLGQAKNQRHFFFKPQGMGNSAIPACLLDKDEYNHLEYAFTYFDYMVQEISILVNGAAKDEQSDQDIPVSLLTGQQLINAIVDKTGKLTDIFNEFYDTKL